MDHPFDNELRRLEDELRGPLRRAALPSPTPDETAQLIASLQGEFNQLRIEPESPKLDFNPQVDPPSLKQILRSQIRLNQRSILLTAGAVFCMLVMLIDPEYPLDQFAGLPGGIFPLITPLLLIVSMLFSSRTWDKGMRAVETLTPYPPALVLYTRLLLVTGIVVGMALLSTLALGLRSIQAESSRFLFGPFILEWMGILLVTGGAAMYMLFRKGMVYSLISAVLVYGMWIVIQGQIVDHGVSMSGKMLTDMSLLVIGLILLISSYGRSLKLNGAWRMAND
ncbi:hypothetical protein V4V36_18575 [Paenibacillus lautus]|jgi:hypothetical protein|uniref:Uncharacterized protein n=1 Tax=Paenibacillus lautus TaxID=1401 RepID=A0A385TI69_PAELA|nr:hypothetical protein [Paenibacillus lautus]AYB42137.1 hypothetical protein D5F53_02020 [Paenibacillus lautus]MBY0163976.1 hypothetical protein [Cytobacillus firmus]MCI1774594.1 hypothetical protein [Paenibacillus lautus]VTR57828.1 Uncharacterised protein [Actinobacillus pleuropneumoniae]